MKIHLSSSTQESLETVGGYSIQCRGEIEVKVRFLTFLKALKRTKFVLNNYTVNGSTRLILDDTSYGKTHTLC